ncbi:MAG: hypothetical protein JSV63_02755 [Candidatus Aenigmatarchaeota archaeon]|nr:MAG: hypothetical protein JSV63_02755 [Candidatus Aenigmarchaeota archaeon]
MKIYIKPEYFQIIHYYFFSLGMFSLTIAFTVPLSDIYSYLFISFYIIHSAISWYISWFLYKRVSAIYIIHGTIYIFNHVVLTLLSGGSAVFFYYAFRIEFQAMMSSLITINFFIIFAGFIWYFLGLTKVIERFFEWQEGWKLREGRKAVMKFRKKQGLFLTSEDVVKTYKWGTDSTIDSALMSIKRKAGEGIDFHEDVKALEIKLAKNRMSEMHERIVKLETGEMSESDRDLANSYLRAIKVLEKRIMDYEKRFFKMFEMSE